MIIKKLKPKDLDILYSCWKKEKHIGGNFRLVRDVNYGVQYYPNVLGKIITVLLFPVYIIIGGWSDAVDTVKDVLSGCCAYTFWVFDRDHIAYCKKIEEGSKHDRK